MSRSMKGTATVAIAMQPAVYILAGGHNGTLYVGVTSARPVRMVQHEKGLIDGSSKRYRVTTD